MKTYDPKDIIAIYGAVPLPISGFAPRTFVTLERSNPYFVDKVGCDGEITRRKTRDSRGYVSFTLLMTSAWNLSFATIQQTNEYLGIGAFPLLVKWKLTDIYFSPEAWIETPPKIIFSNNIESREWRIRCKNLIMYPGGST